MHRQVYIPAFLQYNCVDAACSNFKCLDSNPKSVVIQGITFSCGDSYCNKYGLDNCSPCVKDLCFFKCLKDRSKFVIEGVEYPCPKDTYCNPNWDKNSQCLPCQKTECTNEQKYFSCDPNNETVAIVQGVMEMCFTGYTCNRYYDEPCHVCLKSSDTSVQPTPTTTTTRAPTTTTQPPPFVMPNCKDGNALRLPCRPGAPGSQVYYKCQHTILNGYVADTRSCSYLMYDSTCRKYTYLCR